jgi:hypothetical protein
VAIPLKGGSVTVRVAGDRITTGVFSASLAFEADLFTVERRVRVSARNRRGMEVAKVVAGDGYEEETGAVRLHGASPQVITFRITAPLAKGDQVTIHVYDADTDRLSTTSQPAHVATQVEVD